MITHCLPACLPCVCYPQLLSAMASVHLSSLRDLVRLLLAANPLLFTRGKLPPSLLPMLPMPLDVHVLYHAHSPSYSLSLAPALSFSL